MRNKTLGFAVLALVSAMTVAGPGAEARETPLVTQRTSGEAVGASIVHPASWNVEREPYTFDDTYGYTLWYPETDTAHAHGGTPALRVALAYEMGPADIGAKVEKIRATNPELSLGRETVDVARGHEGVAVGTIPGSTPYTAVYTPVGGRVYKINVYADDPGTPGLDAASRDLLADVRFERPSKSAESLDLPAANSAEALGAPEDPDLIEREEATREAAEHGTDSSVSSMRTSSKGGAEEKRIAEGCYRADPQFWVQTQHGKYANKNRYGNRRPGWTRIGLYNYWGQYSHGNLGYGRCASDYYTNDKFAVDYFLRSGDVIFSPFRDGTVRFAGRAESHKNYGRFVVIRHPNGKYVSMSAHLSGLNVRKGASVGKNRIIGFAGNSGDPSVPVGKPHLHQAFYRNPSFLDRGQPYGGRGLKVVRHHYVGTAAGDSNGGVHTFGRKPRSDKTCRTSIVCGKGYFISN
jgi:murein DD-endopeptidase MepM/ murein hydrolase activator NlpD